MLIEIQNELSRLHALGLLNGLLADRTTGNNILWATDAYAELGEEYQHDQEITIDLITGDHAGVIQNRAQKELEQQSQRTRQHAEVFTPLWVCNKMINYADEAWFGRPDVFNENGVPTKKVVFPERKDWRDYVGSCRLEITCGEAPYLVSRYDVSTGESIEIKNRIGILDRKLRVVSEKTRTESGWLKETVRAFQSTYGYEFQGDNVLIARMNLLLTFEDYLMAKWHRRPTRDEYRRITEIIVWNIWQMDGLTGAIPYSQAGDPEEDTQQITLFESPQETAPSVCRIYDWQEKRSLEFRSLSRGNETGIL